MPSLSFESAAKLISDAEAFSIHTQEMPPTAQLAYKGCGSVPGSEAAADC